MSMIGRPGESEHAPYFTGYVGLVPETDVLAVLAAQPEELQALMRTVPAERELFAYAGGKWTIREVFGHITDAERVFGHRAFCISRGELATLPAFDENAYVAQSSASAIPLHSLLEEFALVRAANLVVLRRLEPSGWMRTGQLSSGPASVRALAFIMAGHVRHHVRVLHERYGLGA